MRSVQRLPHASPTRLGSALLPALIAVVTVGSLSAIALKTSVATLNEERAAAARKQAFYVAEAGLAEAFASLATGGGGNIGSQDKPAKLGGGYVFVEALEDEWGHFKLTSFGLVEDARVRLGAVVEPEEIHLGELGFFAANCLVVGEGSQLLVGGDGQGVESSELPAAPPPLKVQSNGSIEIQGGSGNAATVIDGDVVPGPEATLTLGGSVQINGTSTPGSLELEIPAASPPEVSPFGDVNVAAGLAMSFGGRDAAADSVTVGANATLTLVGPSKIVLDALTLEAGAQLIADGSAGPVELFIGGSLTIADSAGFGNATGQSGDFSLALLAQLGLPAAAAEATEAAGSASKRAGKDLLKVEEVTEAVDVLQPTSYTLRSATPFIGTVVAPEAAVVLESGTQFLGSILAYDLTLEPGTEAYFDPRLGDCGPLLGGGIKLKSWRILSVPQELSSVSYDPERDYEVSGEVPPTLREAQQAIRMVATVLGEDGEKYEAYVDSASNLPPGIAMILETKYPSDFTAEKDYEVTSDGYGELIKLARVRAVADNVLTSDKSDWSGE